MNEGQDQLIPQGPVRSRPWIWGLVAGLLLLHIGLALTAIAGKSTTCDEVAHLTAGYTKWRTGDFRLVPEHPPLAQLWAALPLNLMDVKLPSLDQPSWWCSNQWQFGDEWLFKSGNDPQRLLFAGRSMIALLSAALGLAVFAWSRRLFGVWGGIISLALYAFCPTLLANGAVVTTDMAVGLFFLLAAMTVWMALHRVTPWTVLLSGLSLGGLFLAKMSAILIAPIYGLMLLVRLFSRAPLLVRMAGSREIRSRAGRLGAHAAVVFAQALLIAGIIWVGHGLRFSAMRGAVAGRDHLPVPDTVLPDGAESWNHLLERRGALGDLVDAARRMRILPEAYLYGFAFAIDMTRGSDAFLNGRRSTNGFTSFFPYCFLYKTTLPSLLLLMAGLAVVLARVRHPAQGVRQCASGGALLYELTPLLALLVVYASTAVASSFNIGHRHLLPIYPPLFIICGALAGFLNRRVVVVGLALHAIASLSVWPNYLAYFNLLAGGPAKGYRHLVDSSLDWGQDLRGLKRWLDRNAGGSPVYLSYMGNDSTVHCGIKANLLPTFPPHRVESLTGPLAEGIYCISSTNLQQVRILPVSGWTQELERVYQRCAPRVRELNRSALPAASPGGIPDDMVTRLRFARLCAAIRKRAPDDTIGHSILIYRLTQGEIDAALFGPAPESAADDAECLVGMGDLFIELGAAAPAEEFYRLALKARPDDAHVHHNLGVVLGQMGRLDESLPELREAVRIKPDFAEAWENLGNAFAVAGQFGEAVPNYERAIELRPRKVEPYSSLGDVFALTDNLDKAIAMYSKVLALRPNWPEAHVGLASVLARKRDFDGAVRHYGEALRLRPDWAATHNNLGIALAEWDRRPEATAAFSEAVRLDPANAPAHANLASAMLEAGDYDGAIRHFNEALRLQPGTQNAEAGLRKALELRSNSAGGTGP